MYVLLKLATQYHDFLYLHSMSFNVLDHDLNTQCNIQILNAISFDVGIIVNKKYLWQNTKVNI